MRWRRGLSSAKKSVKPAEKMALKDFGIDLQKIKNHRATMDEKTRWDCVSGFPGEEEVVGGSKLSELYQLHGRNFSGENQGLVEFLIRGFHSYSMACTMKIGAVYEEETRSGLWREEISGNLVNKDLGNFLNHGESGE
ncbi:hypothetical protein U1Q18_000085 [Sarracenia purpurea var. burkii]